MKAFISGACGFIGSHLCEALRDAGHEVTGLALYNSFDNYGWLDEVEGVKKIRGDIRDVAQIFDQIQGHDIVFHLAALISVPYSYPAPQSFIDTNVMGTLNVLQACLLRETKIVYASTSEIYGTVHEPITEDHPLNPQSPYAASKVAAEMLVRAFHHTYGLPAAILRPFNTYGPRQSQRALVPTIIRQHLDPDIDELELGRLDTKRDLSYVADTVRAFMAMAEGDFDVCNSGTGLTWCGQHIVDTVSKLTGINKPVALREDRMRPETSEVECLRSDISKLTQRGWHPEWPLVDGLNMTIDWWQKREFGTREFMV